MRQVGIGTGDIDNITCKFQVSPRNGRFLSYVSTSHVQHQVWTYRTKFGLILLACIWNGHIFDLILLSFLSCHVTTHLTGQPPPRTTRVKYRTVWPGYTDLHQRRCGGHSIHIVPEVTKRGQWILNILSAFQFWTNTSNFYAYFPSGLVLNTNKVSASFIIFIDIIE